jgi:hypothetical protein
MLLIRGENPRRRQAENPLMSLSEFPGPALVLIEGDGRKEKFEFVLRIPGARFLGQNLATESPYRDTQIRDVDLSALKRTLQTYPC